MATSGSVDWNLTRDEIITEALEDLGVLDVGDSPETNDVTSASRGLNVVLKSLQSDPFIHLRFIEEQTVSLVDGTGSYDLASDTMKVMDAWLRIDSEDTHLDVISKEEYDLIVNKTEENQPQRVYIDYAADIPKAYFNPVPEASYTAYFVNERRIEDMDAAANNVDLPVEAIDMVIKGLCAKLAKKFQLPIDERAFHTREFETAKRDYKAGDTNRYGKEVVAPRYIV